MAEQASMGRARETSERVHSVALRAIAAAVVLVVFAGLASPVSIDRLEGGALLLYAGGILGCILNAVWRGR